MENQIKLTVLLICYNHEKYIEQAINSVLNQKTSFRFKVVIHDDASTDKSKEIIKKYIEKYPDLITGIFQEENQYSKGVHNIISKFMRDYVEGDYVAVCECDDYWIDNNKLQKQVDFLDNHSEYSGCMHNCITVNSKNETIDCVYDIYKPYISHTYSLKRLALNNSFPGQSATKVYRSKYLFYKSKEEEEAIDSIRTNGDVKNNLYLLLNGKIYCMEEFMSAYRVVNQEGSSWSAKNYGKNMSYKYFISSIDVRNFAKKFYKINFRNEYVTFHSGIAGIIKYALNPTIENKKVFTMIKNEKKLVFLYLICMGIYSIPQIIQKRYDKKLYRLEV